MKKMFLALVAVFALQCSAQAFAADKVIQFSELPATARNFVKKHFATVKVASVWIDDDLLDKDYTVKLVDGSSVDFSSKGEWTEVDCSPNALPWSTIPSKIAAYVTTHYADTKAVKIERESRGGFELELANGYSLKFDSAQKFLRLDD